MTKGDRIIFVACLGTLAVLLRAMQRAGQARLGDYEDDIWESATR